MNETTLSADDFHPGTRIRNTTSGTLGVIHKVLAFADGELKLVKADVTFPGRNCPMYVSIIPAEFAAEWELVETLPTGDADH